MLAFFSRGLSILCVADEAARNVYTWGKNEFGQLGHGNTTEYKLPRKVRNHLRKVCLCMSNTILTFMYRCTPYMNESYL